MAELDLSPGNTSVVALARAKVNRLPRGLSNPPGGLYPLRSSAWEVDEYRIMAGWPVAVPECDIRAEVLVTGDGTVLGNRDAPTSLVTGADMRWIADVNFYDQTTLTWAPIQGHVPSWETSPESAPTLVTDYEYTFGDERFTSMTALNFDSDTGDYMWSDLSLAMGGTSGYTVIMVVCPNSIYGTNPDINRRALWGPADTVGDEAWTGFTVRDQAIWCDTEASRPQAGVSINDALESSAPFYLAMVVARPQTATYAASGPGTVRVKSVAIGGLPVPQSTVFWLGNSSVASAGTMDMVLLDLGIYANPLKRSEVAAEFASLATIYGGDS